MTLLGGGLLVPTTIALALYGQQFAAISRARAWMAAGAACPVVSSQVYGALNARAASTFDFAGARFTRAYGYANCGEIADDGAVGRGRVAICQFNNPTIVDIATPRRHVFFMTGVLPATVTIATDGPRCVLGANLEPNWLRR